MGTVGNKQIMAKNIRRQMERKGISNQQLCDDLGFKYTTFMDWIKGVTYPRIGKIEAMADYFGILKSDLIEEKPPEYLEMQIKNDTLASVIVRMRTDEKFFAAAELLERLEPEQLEMVVQFLKTFVK